MPAYSQLCGRTMIMSYTIQRMPCKQRALDSRTRTTTKRAFNLKFSRLFSKIDTPESVVVLFLHQSQHAQGLFKRSEGYPTRLEIKLEVLYGKHVKLTKKRDNIIVVCQKYRYGKYYRRIPSTDVIQLTLTLKMTTAQVVETSVTVNNNSPIQDYVHADDQTQPTFDTLYRSGVSDLAQKLDNSLQIVKITGHV